MEDIIRLHIPSNIAYTGLVEDFMRALGTKIFPNDNISRDNLSTVMNEIFTNIVRHSDTSRVDGIVRFKWQIGASDLKISIYDHGPGIPIAKKYPPYPPELLGTQHEYRRVLDGIVCLKIIEPNSVAFSFEPDVKSPDHPDNLKNLKGHGLGLSIMTKIMDSVVYVMRDDGQFDWQLTKNIL